MFFARGNGMTVLTSFVSMIFVTLFFLHFHELFCPCGNKKTAAVPDFEKATLTWYIVIGMSDEPQLCLAPSTIHF